MFLCIFTLLICKGLSLATMVNLVNKYHPVFWFHSKEKYFPVNPKDYIELSSLVYINETLIKYPNLKCNNLTDSNVNPLLGKPYKRNFNFKLKMEKGYIFEKGNKNYILGKNISYPYKRPVPIFVYISEVSSNFIPEKDIYNSKFGKTTYIDLIFYIHYSHNGTLDFHNYDIEFITIRINKKTKKIYKIYLSQHGEGEWISYSDISYYKKTHPIIYSAYESHAMYSKKGKFVRIYNFGTDFTDNGYFWVPFNLVILPKNMKELSKDVLYLAFVGNRSEHSGQALAPYHQSSTRLSLNYDCSCNSFSKIEKTIGSIKKLNLILSKLNSIMTISFLTSCSLSFLAIKNRNILYSLCSNIFLSISILIFIILFLFGYFYFDFGSLRYLQIIRILKIFKI